MALAHKGLDCDARATRFTEISSICDGERETLPTIEDGDKVVSDSWSIVIYLDAAYPDRPSLFGGDAGKTLTTFVQNWVTAELHSGVIRMVVLDILEHLAPEDRDYFRATREKRFGKPLEQVQAGREDRLDAFRARLNPLRSTVKASPFIGGERPMYADYLVFGAFQWARSISPFRLLADDDPIAAWFGRCLDLYDGLGRKSPGYY